MARQWCSREKTSTRRPSIVPNLNLGTVDGNAYSRLRSKRLRVDLPATGAQSSRRASNFAGKDRHHRIMAQIVVVNEVLEALRHAENTLLDQRTSCSTKSRRRVS